MKEHEFADLLGGIDSELIARAEAPVRKASKPGFKIALIAAALAIIICAALLIVPFIPTTLDIEYTAQGTAMQNAWIHYVTENGTQKREYVRLPDDEQSVFAAWAHLSGIDAEVSLHDVQHAADNTVILTVSTALEQHPDSEALLESLLQTYSAYCGIPAQSISFVFANHPVTLEFSHDLTDTPVLVKSRDTFTVTVTMTNISDEDIVFEGAESDFVPKVKLLSGSSEIYPEPHDNTTEIAQYRLAPGQSRSMTYTFRIPYTTSNAIASIPYLTVYFGEQSRTFENVVTLIYAYAASGAKSAFQDFTLAHTSEDSAQLQSIWGSYTYRGKNIMEQISVWSDSTERYWFEQGEYNQFSYFSSRAQMEYGWLSYYSHNFTARALPDGMELPMGITTQDSILEALIKLGVDEQTATEYLAQEGVITLDGTSFLDMASSYIEKYHSTIDLVCNQIGYTIICTVEEGIIAQDDPYPHATRSIALKYDPDSRRFLSMNLNVNLPTRPNVTLDALPTFTEVAGKECSITLTQEQADALVVAMNRGKWQAHTVPAERAEYNCEGMIGDILFEYSTVTGQLTVGGFTVQLYSNDMIELNGILGITTRSTIE